MPKNLPNSLLYLLSLSAGLVVANLYYSQPLLHEIALDFNVNETTASHVALASQIGYTLGLLFIIPLGDKLSNHRILLVNFIMLIISLFAAAVSTTINQLIISHLFIGATSIIPQLFVPMAAQLSNEKNRGRSIGIVMSGLLIGILGSRVLSGFIGEEFGWRTVFYAATIMMIILFIILRIKLPTLIPDYKGSYAKLMKSIYHYFKTEPSLRLASLRGGLGFAALSAFWTTLAFLMESSFGYGSTVAGLFGLIGIGGALAATYVGKLNDKMNSNRIVLYSILTIIASWGVLFFSAHSIIGLVLGVILIDLGKQALHISNQNIIFSKNQEARNRVNTVYMVSFFIGGAVGTSLSAFAWQHYKWAGVSTVGLSLSILLLISHLTLKKSEVK